MKIIFLEIAQNYGGARISTIELAQRLSSNNNEIVIYDLYGTCKPFVEACYEKGIKLKIVDKRLNPFIIRSSPNILVILIKYIRFIPHIIYINKKLCKLLNEDKADYIIVNSSKVLTFLIGKRFNAKIIFYVRGWGIKKQMLDNFLSKKLVDKVICVSESTRQILYCNKIAKLENLHVVHNAIDEKTLPTNIAKIECDKNCIKILHSAGFLPSKGQHISLEIANRLREKNIKFKMVLAGIIYKGYASQKYYEEIIQMINKYGLEDNIKLVINKSNVIDYFRACDILIHPSETEGLPRVVMEAMILKKPVIANAVGGVTDFILDGFTGFIPRYNYVDDYVESIISLSTNNNLYNYISENAYSLVKMQYTFDLQLEKIYKVF